MSEEGRPDEKYTILTQSEEEYQRQMKALSSLNFESMVEMTLNEDLLKNNFKTITEILKKQYKLINMCTQNIDQLGKEKDGDSRLEKLDKGQRELRELVSRLIKENEANRQDLNSLQKEDSRQQMDDLKTQGEQAEKRVEGLEQGLKDLMDKLAALGAGGKDWTEDIKRLQDMLLLLKDKGGANNNQTQQQSIQAGEDLKSELEKLRGTLERVKEQLLDKVDVEDFEDIVNQLKAMLAAQAAGGTVAVQQIVEVPRSRDGNRLGQLEGRVKELEEMLKNQGGKLSDLLEQLGQLKGQGEQRMQTVEDYFKGVEDTNQALSQQLTALEERMKKVEDTKADRSELKKAGEDKDKLKRELMDIINKLKEVVSNCGQKVEGNTVDLEELKRKMEAGNKKFNELQKKANQNGAQADQQKIIQLIDNAVNALRDELTGLINKLQQQVDKKDFEQDMLAYQQKIFQKIDEIVGALIKKLANKEDTKKALGYLEKKIGELYLLISPEEKGQKELDGLMVKRPLFWSCVSCDKDLDQYQGRLGDYKNWKVFPPKETSPERMGRFGVGYAQMMQNRKHNIEKEKELNREKDLHNQATNTNTHNNFNQSHGTTGFPEINTNEKSKYRK